MIDNFHGWLLHIDCASDIFLLAVLEREMEHYTSLNLLFHI